MESMLGKLALNVQFTMPAGTSVILMTQVGAILFCATSVRAQTGGCGTLSGAYTSAACVPSPGTSATITTAPGTTVTTASGTSIRAAARAADATVSLSGTTINNNGANAAIGVQSQVTSGTGNASVLFSGGTDSITMQAGSQDGVSVTNVSTGTSSISVAPGTTLNITDKVVGNERDGLDVNATGGGNVSVVHNGSGAISVAGGNALWLKAVNAGNIAVTLGNGINLSVDNTNATSAASNHAGIHTRATGAGNTIVESAATIQDHGTNAFGIYTEAALGATSVRNTGAITTDGLNGFGIRSTAGGGAIEIRNAGAITTTGAAAHAIYANAATATNTGISVDNQGALTVGSATEVSGARAIYLTARGTGGVVVTGSGNISVLGSAATLRGQGIIVSAERGNVGVDYSGAMTVHGLGAGGIRADSSGGNVQVNYTGSGIETFNSNANGIYATATSATGTVGIAAQGTIVTHSDAGSGDGTGISSFGLQGYSQGGDVSVSFTGPKIDVNGSGAALLAANAYTGTGLGTLTVANSGELIARGDRQQGIHTRSSTGAQTITNHGPIQTYGVTNSAGILAESTGAAAISVVNEGAVTTRGANSTGIDGRTQGGSIDIRNSAPVSAGWGSSVGVSLGGATQTLNNTSSIGALSDIAVLADTSGLGASDNVTLEPIDPAEPVAALAPVNTFAAASSPVFALTNAGGMTGVVNASASAVTFENSGVWNLRNFVDSTGSGVRDTWNVALSNLGSSGSNSINNTGTLNLSAQPGAGIKTFNAAGAYLPFGQANNTPVPGGAVQGQIFGVTTFTNSGTIDLTGGSRAVGNVLIIGGGQAAGVDGGGAFVSNGGTLKLNTVLNDGAANSRSDMLVVDSTRTGAGGPTRIQVSNIGGAGAVTNANGIPVVEILNKTPAASDANAFALKGRAVAGPYEYRLFRGADDGSATDAWYLRSEQPVPPNPPSPPGPPAPPVPPAPPGPPEPLYRPEVAAYEANQRLAGMMFVHSLHDRLGEPQYLEGQGFNPDSDKPKSGWLRVVGRWEGSESKDGVFKTSTNSFLLNGGLEVAKWKLASDTDRLHAGVMASYGTANSDADAQGNTAHAKGDVEGWAVGAYGTWYQNDAQKLGAYVDTWFQYGWFSNRVEGDQLPTVKYHAQGLGVSGEVGYALPVAYDWVVEPQAQLIYVDYNENDITEPNGTSVSGADSSGIITRLGVRTSRTWTQVDGRKVQPYFTVNWWYSDTDSSISFNQLPVGSLYPHNRFEAKLGVNADLGKRWTAWTNVSGSWGQQNYYQYALRVGAKYTW
jgi:autotransporter family porin